MTETWFRDALERGATPATPPPSAMDVLHRSRQSHRRRTSTRAGIGLSFTAIAAVAAVLALPLSAPRPANIRASDSPPLAEVSVPVLNQPGITEPVPPAIAQELQSASLDPASLAIYVQQSTSMTPTLQPGDHVLIHKGAMVSRGSLVVFNAAGTRFPLAEATGGAAGGVDPYLAKRVLAVGGDTISCPPLMSDPGTCSGILVNGHKVNESAYLFEDRGTFTAPDQQAFPARTVSEGQFFVLGDHRDDSSDSRPNGSIPQSTIVGVAIAVDTPADHAQLFGLTGVPSSSPQPTTVETTSALPSAASPSSGPLADQGTTSPQPTGRSTATPSQSPPPATADVTPPTSQTAYPTVARHPAVPA